MRCNTLWETKQGKDAYLSHQTFPYFRNTGRSQLFLHNLNLSDF
jgi:hypothetical protein